jgi:hypothetical protein
VSVPARKPAGVVIPGTEVETLSDLLFFLADIVPPRVRTSRYREDADLRRLSFRDLLWYCYLDQDEIDSTFFHLDKTSDFKLNKSRDVLRFILRFHSEHIAEIEAELEALRGKRLALNASIAGLNAVLEEVSAKSETALQRRINALRDRAEQLAAQLGEIRQQVEREVRRGAHTVDILKQRARALGDQLELLESSRIELEGAISRDRAHLSELETLRLKVRRSVSARGVLQKVDFAKCPRCTQVLPERPSDACMVCGQSTENIVDDPTETLRIEKDVIGRIEELTEVDNNRRDALREQKRETDTILGEKNRVERELTELSAQYDSAYLAASLSAERERASLLQQAQDLESLMRFYREVDAQREELERISGREVSRRAELRAARENAERNESHLNRLEQLFLDCLLRSKLPGISRSDHVEISKTDFLPTVWAADSNHTTVTSFGNMSSGGKKTLFKCCFAVAVHRLAVEIGASLPTFLIIDSPMKNISERENKEQFERFHQMLYDLKSEELADTQLILIDKEYYGPPANVDFSVIERHMQPNEPGHTNHHPPLIPYYSGH